mmetsp:Transcript_15523/g.40215  ORF Transcript_15523/g.40215 Transcript_15523/m.40215 type:complete len:200 (-) Transcript_15523:152-751(-)
MKPRNIHTMGVGICTPVRKCSLHEPGGPFKAVGPKRLVHKVRQQRVRVVRCFHLLSKIAKVLNHVNGWSWCRSRHLHDSVFGLLYRSLCLHGTRSLVSCCTLIRRGARQRRRRSRRLLFHGVRTCHFRLAPTSKPIFHHRRVVDCVAESCRPQVGSKLDCGKCSLLRRQPAIHCGASPGWLHACLASASFCELSKVSFN